MSYCFKIISLAEICIKMYYFYWKFAKLAQTHMPPAAGGQTPANQPTPLPQREILATPLTPS